MSSEDGITDSSMQGFVFDAVSMNGRSKNVPLIHSIRELSYDGS